MKYLPFFFAFLAATTLAAYTASAQKATRVQRKELKKQKKQKKQSRLQKPLSHTVGQVQTPEVPASPNRFPFMTPLKYRSLLGKGLDVDWSKTGPGVRFYHQQAVADFKTAGLSHVRIRVTQDAGPELFASLDRQVMDCLAHGLIPIIAYQGNAFKESASQADLEAVVAWWDAVADRYKYVSPLLSFDLIIEVTDALNRQPEMLNELYEKATTAIRRTNMNRIIFISPRLRSSPEYLPELRLPSRANNQVMAEWHFYASGPSQTNPNKLWTTGTPAEKKIIQDKILAAKTWERQTGILTWVGAWMPGNYNDGDDYSIDEQVVFARFVAGELDRAGVPFAVNSDTKFYDREARRWIPQMFPVMRAFLRPGR